MADFGNNLIQEFTSGGSFVTQWGGNGTGNGKFAYPYGVAVALSGNVYVADTENNIIQEFTSNGSFLTQWGGLGAGNGLFDYPLGVAVAPSGNVYVADYGNDLVQEFTSCLSPTPTSSPTATVSPTPTSTNLGGLTSTVTKTPTTTVTATITSTPVSCSPALLSSYVFDTGTQCWTAWGSVTATVSQDTTNYYAGGGSLKVVLPFTSNIQQEQIGIQFPGSGVAIPAGSTISMEVMASNNGNALQLFDQSGANAVSWDAGGWVNAGGYAAGTWFPVSYMVNPGAPTSVVQFGLEVPAGSGSSYANGLPVTVWIDNVTITPPVYCPVTMVDAFATEGPVNLWGGTWTTIGSADTIGVTYDGPGTNGDPYSAGVTGTLATGGWANWYTFLYATDTVFDAAANGLQGIQFWMKGDGGTYRMVVFSQAVTDNDYYGVNVTPPNDGNWHFYPVPFSSMVTVGWGTQTGLPSHFGATDLLGLQFETVTAPSTFAFSVDQIAFYCSTTAEKAN